MPAPALESHIPDNEDERLQARYNMMKTLLKTRLF
jgi:hypothetical protein